jgi:hypothetical protein
MVHVFHFHAICQSSLAGRPMPHYPGPWHTPQPMVVADRVTLTQIVHVLCLVLSSQIVHGHGVLLSHVVNWSSAVSASLSAAKVVLEKLLYFLCAIVLCPGFAKMSRQ